MYVRAEREGEFGLHLYVCKKMIPYFFAAGHWNYARDGTVYIRMMENLPDSVLNKFMKGQHVVHLQDGFWNGIWSDMAIESTCMKIGKGPSGIVGGKPPVFSRILASPSANSTNSSASASLPFS